MLGFVVVISVVLAELTTNHVECAYHYYELPQACVEGCLAHKCGKLERSAILEEFRAAGIPLKHGRCNRTDMGHERTKGVLAQENRASNSTAGCAPFVQYPLQKAMTRETLCIPYHKLSLGRCVETCLPTERKYCREPFLPLRHDLAIGDCQSLGYIGFDGKVTEEDSECGSLDYAIFTKSPGVRQIRLKGATKLVKSRKRASAKNSKAKLEELGGARVPKPKAGSEKDTKVRLASPKQACLWYRKFAIGSIDGEEPRWLCYDSCFEPKVGLCPRSLILRTDPDLGEEEGDSTKLHKGKCASVLPEGVPPIAQDEQIHMLGLCGKITYNVYEAPATLSVLKLLPTKPGGKDIAGITVQAVLTPGASDASSDTDSDDGATFSVPFGIQTSYNATFGQGTLFETRIEKRIDDVDDNYRYFSDEDDYDSDSNYTEF